MQSSRCNPSTVSNVARSESTPITTNTEYAKSTCVVKNIQSPHSVSFYESMSTTFAANIRGNTNVARKDRLRDQICNATPLAI